MSRRRKVVAVVASLAVIVAALVAAGVLAAPSGGVEDVGDWGEVTEERTEVVTTLWVNNPNPIGVSVGMQADYRVKMNGVTVARGEKDGLTVRQGNHTKELHTYIQNEKLRPWWVAYVENDETITTVVAGEASVGTPLGRTTIQFPDQQRTMLKNSTPVISAISGAASRMEGRYAKTTTVAGQSVGIGYEVTEANASWGDVDERTTTVLIRYRVSNVGDVPLPAVPDGLRFSVTMNDIEVFQGGTDSMTVRNAGRDATIQPGETRTIVLAMEMDNDKIDDWFRSHVRNGERTTLQIRLGLQFEHEASGTTIDVPPGGVATTTCDVRTAILVDDQESSTDCAPGGV